MRTFPGGLAYDATNVGITNQTEFLPPALVFPVSQLLNFTQLSRSDFISLYCEPARITTSKLLAMVGDTGSRYQAAVNQAIAQLASSAFFQTSVRLHRSAKSVFKNLKSIRKLSFVQLPPPVTQLSPYGQCMSNSDCTTLGRRRYCIDASCRESSASTWQSDCPNSPEQEMCSAETGYTCSQCLDDSGCSLVGGVCRFVFPNLNVTYPLMPRKVCTLCPQVPVSAEIFDASTCQWRCPTGTAFDYSSGACVTAPTCPAASQYYGVASSDVKFFYPSYNSVNMTSPICRDCSSLGPVNDADFCASLIDPSNPPPNIPFGTLNTTTSLRPCSSFTCKAGFYLNPTKSMCRPCNYAACPGGYTLTGCGQDQPGRCTPCSTSSKDPNSDWINPRLAVFTVSKASVTCATICKFGFYRNTTNNQCNSCSDLERRSCTAGQTLASCGPGSSSGTCQNCPPAAFNMYFTGNQCMQASCLDRAAGCPAGTTLQGCGGASMGSCVACSGGLPAGALGWKSAGTCDYFCQQGSYRNNATNTCSQCNSLTQCPTGQYLSGCGIDGVSNGTCLPCSPLGRGLYYASGATCQPIRCNAMTCAASQKLVGCGYGLPGSCASCGSPPAGVHFLSRVVTIGAVRQCAPSCNSGFQVAQNVSTPAGLSCQPLPPIDLDYDDNG